MPANTPMSERWKQSTYVAESTFGDFLEWHLILEQPVAPFQQNLFKNYSEKLMLILVILVVSLALAAFLSSRVVFTLDQLRLISHALPLKLARAGRGTDWPKSGVSEAKDLIANFQEMEKSLIQQFSETKAINVSLEQRVQARTSDLSRALGEKEVLLKEVHHRVKNNMQVIRSLLNLQAKSILDPGIRTLFEESRDRVNSMALIHERLYQTEDLAHIDAGSYLETLVQSIAGTYGRTDVSTAVNADRVVLDVNTAIPCGLIVNELVSNSFKHGFPPGKKGEIQLEIRKEGQGSVSLTVTDNGVGLPKDLNPQATATLGLQLVSMLTKQIRGTLHTTSGEGAHFKISFPATATQEDRQHV